MNRNLLLHGAAAVGVLLSDQQIDACDLLLKELVRWNQRINLTAITKPDEMVVKHLVDSLQMLPLLQPGERLLDIGSGAGFPGLVLAIMRPDCSISCIDAVGKKISFQKHISRLLQLKNFQTLHARVEQLALQEHDGFDLVCSRAFSSLSQFVDLSLPLVRTGGRIISMRGVSDDDSEVSALQQRYAALGLQPDSILRYRLPLQMGERSLVILRKTLQTAA